MGWHIGALYRRLADREGWRFMHPSVGVCKRRDKVARSVIANDRNSATSGRWNGRQPTGQIDPTATLAARFRGVRYLIR